MSDKASIIISGRSRGELDTLVEALTGQPGLAVQTRLLNEGELDPLRGLGKMPDVLVLFLDDAYEALLAAFETRPAAFRPALIAVGPPSDAGMLRRAMQAGARDYFSPPFATEDLLTCIGRVTSDQRPQAKAIKSNTTAILNAKGGSGASFIAANLAHILAQHLNQRTALVDLDLQFGMLPVYLGLDARDSIFQAIASADSLDPVALEAYMSRHASGLHLLAAMSDSMAVPWEIPVKRLQKVMGILQQNYQQVVVDLARVVEPLMVDVLEHADQIVLVTQQSVTHMRDTKRMLQLITKELAVPQERITVLINRHDRRSSVTAADFSEAMKGVSVMTVGNDFALVSSSVNLGIPVLQSAKTSLITRSLVEVAERISGTETANKRGSGLKAALSSIFKG